MNRSFFPSVTLTLSLLGLIVTPAFSTAIIEENPPICQINSNQKQSFSEQKQHKNKQYLKILNKHFQIIRCSESENLPQAPLSNPDTLDLKHQEIILQKSPMILEIF